MRAQVQVINADRAKRSVAALAKRLQGKQNVLVGVQQGAGNYDDGTPIAVIAAANHFGATIKHPGGTSYGYRTERDAIAGKSRFLKSGTGFMETGKTGAHTIQIPARPFLDVAIEKNSRHYTTIAKNQIPRVLHGDLTMEQVLDGIGLAAASDVQEYMVELRTPPNAESTKARKGSDNPLVDEGTLIPSIRHQVAQGAVTKGL